MKRFRRRLGILMIIASLIVMSLPGGMSKAADSSSFLMEGATLVAYRGHETAVTVPADTTVIGECAFEGNTTVEKVSFPKSLRRIKPYAFWGCDGLKEIAFGKGLKEIGDYAFTSCQGLTNLTIPSNITYIGIRAFADCTSLKTVTIPETVVFIHETAFDGCADLVIDCPEGSYADKYAREFYRRQALLEEYEAAKVDENADASDHDTSGTVETSESDPSFVPDASEVANEATSDEDLLGSTTIVGNRAVFLISSSTPTVYQGYVTWQEEGIDYPVKYRILNEELLVDQAYYKNTELGDIIVQSGIREIGEFAFARCTANSLYLPEGVEKLDFGAFYHCDSLSNVVLPDTITKVEPKCFDHTAWVSGFLETGEGGSGDFLISGGVLVSYRGEDAELQIPEGVRVIASECFLGHEEIQKVVMPESLTNIGEAAFEGCKGLSRLEWKNGIKTIADRAFAGCALSEVTIPGTVQELGIGAFDQGVTLSYVGREPVRTHETSAERLSNEGYRYLEGDPQSGLMQGGSVLVLGMTGANASLSDAKRPYTLTVSLLEETADRQEAREAMSRNIGTSMRADAMILSASLTDDSGIPITRLERSLLSIAIPVPAAWSGKEILGYRYDRNGQLEPISLRYVKEGEQIKLVLDTELVTKYVLEPSDRILSEEEIDEMESFEETTVMHELTISLDGEEPVEKEIDPWMILKWSCGGVLLMAGLFLALSKVR